MGRFAEAEAAYRRASESGWEPQPGLALMRLAQGDGAAAAAAIHRALGETADPLDRARLLPAHVEIAISVGLLDEARDACRELGEIAKRYPSSLLAAIAAGASGAVDLAEGKALSALVSLRRAGVVWHRHQAPYEVARLRVRVGTACRLLGDHDAANREFLASRAVFERLGAAPDLARLESLHTPKESEDRHGLTARELEVLKLVTAGKTNRAIAAELFISEKTVDRHVGSILGKLDVSSRAAATAYAYQHQLI